MFKNAKFGMMFLTRNDKRALFIEKLPKHNVFCLVVEGEDDYVYTDKYGMTDPDGINEMSTDIVSRYIETIDEDKLDEIASKIDMPGQIVGLQNNKDYYVLGFKAGYRKAKHDSEI